MVGSGIPGEETRGMLARYEERQCRICTTAAAAPDRAAGLGSRNCVQAAAYQAIATRSRTVALAMLLLLSRKIVSKLNPFNGPGSLKAERQQDRREQFKVMVWAILGANVVLFLGMLIQGCRGEPPTGETAGGTAAEVTATDTNRAVVAQQKAGADLPVPPTFVSLLAKTHAANDTVAQPATAAPPTAATASQSPATTSKAAAHYVVKSGDSLRRIARTHGTTVQAIKAANGLTSDRIAAGQDLKLPESKTASASTSRG